MNMLATPLRRRVLFAALYLSEGAPIGFLWWHLPTRLRAAGVPIENITGLTALLVLPWTLKFLWAPLIDARRARGGTARSWIVTCQVAMGLSLLPLLWLDLSADLGWVTVALLAHAVAAATQDVAIDTLTIAVTPPRERGTINGWMQAGMLLGRSAFGGVALIVGARAGMTPVILALVAAVWGSLALVLFADERGATADAPEARPGAEAAPARDAGPKTFGATLIEAFRARNTWLGLAFALVAGAGFEAVGAVAGPFLIDRGLRPEEVGAFLALPVVSAMLVGGLVGGPLSDRGRRGVVAGFLVLMAAAILGLAAVAGGSRPALLALLTVVYFGIGLLVAASYALFMDLTHPRLGATQFSAFMAATNACESWAGFTIGRLVPGLGYPGAFVAMAALSLLALPALLAIRLPARGGPRTGADPAAPRT